MDGLFLMFVMIIALYSLVSGYLEVLNHADENHWPLFVNPFPVGRLCYQQVSAFKRRVGRC